MNESKFLTQLLAGAAGAASRADGLDDREDPESSQNGSDVAREGGQESVRGQMKSGKSRGLWEGKDISIYLSRRWRSLNSDTSYLS